MDGDHASGRSFVPWIRAAAVVDAMIGFVALAGWTWNVRTLKQLSPDLPAMKPNTAAMMVVAAAGLWAVADDAWEGGRRRLGALAGGLVFLVAGLTLVEYLWRGLGIDELVFHDVQGTYPGRPSPHTALVFLLVGANLVLLASPRTTRRAAHLVNGAAAVAVGFGLIGYAYDVDYLRGVSGATGIAVQTLTGLVIVVLGLALVEPRKGWMSVLTAPGPGGRMARTSVPIVLGTPILFGFEHRFFDSTWGRAVAAACITAIVIALLFGAAIALEQTEAERVQLAGLLPICSHCKRIRDEQGYWNALEVYIESHSEASFSHSLCSSCLAEHYPEVAGAVERRLASRDRGSANVTPERLH